MHSSMASKQIFTTGPLSREVCIQQPDGICIKETIEVRPLHVTYKKRVFRASDEVILKGVGVGDDEGGEGRTELEASGVEELGGLKERVRKLPLVAPELATMAINMLDMLQSRQQSHQ